MSSSAKAIRLVLIEDQTAIREMLSEILRTDSTYEVVGQCGDGLQACQLCLDAKPDVLVLDARLPSLSGLELLRRIGKRLKNTRVLVFSGYEDPALVRAMLEAGAHGFVEKTAGLVEFKKGLATVAGGGNYFGPGVAALLRTVVVNHRPADNFSALSKREREVLKLVAESNRTREIAQKLGISAKTVDNHRTNLMRKLKRHDVASLTRHALEIGLVDQRTGLR